MTADEFVATLGRLAADRPVASDVDEWATIIGRLRPAFEHPPDPILELLARYDVSRVKFWQLEFADGKAPCFDGLWHVATKTTDTYDVEDGERLHMCDKPDYPGATGLSSGQFLDVLAVYARMVAQGAENPSGPRDVLLVEHADLAAAVSPRAADLDWFFECRRR